MAFTRRVAAALIVLLPLAGCGVVGERESAKEDPPEPPTEQEFTPIPDPYWENPKPLPPGSRGEFARATEAMEAEQWQEAQNLLVEMVELYPQLSGPWVSLGLVYKRQQELDKAAEAFERAIEINPLNGQAYNQLAILHREQGEFEEAEKIYQQALKVWPHNPVAHRNLGILYDLYMGRFSEALKHYQMSQKVAQEPDRSVEGWVVDLQRRIEQQAASR